MIPTRAAGWLSAGLVCALVAVAPALAHHSGAMFDASRPVTLRGVVQLFEWTNPHSRIVLVADRDAVDAGKTWVVETTSPGRLSRGGWTRRSLVVGDHVEVKVAPARNSGLFGNLMEIRNLDTGVALARPD